ncbi:MAG: putative calpain 7 [Streblomastix strix]|uniref:Putative calpain 7 n=1 Tax=Streblomastix strix TaxID=222440 RepID=A0A5J4WXR4_9EUKA|nr:MAG: putative calpain 7 [Streblomastix strix]
MGCGGSKEQVVPIDEKKISEYELGLPGARLRLKGRYRLPTKERSLEVQIYSDGNTLFAFVVPPADDETPEKECSRVLLQSSNFHGHTLPIWKKEHQIKPTPPPYYSNTEKYNFEGFQFTKQIDLVRGDDIYESSPTNPISLFKEQSTYDNIKQQEVNDCGVVSSFLMMRRIEKLGVQKILTDKMFPQDSKGIATFNPCGKYNLKVFVNGTFRLVQIDDKLPCKKLQNWQKEGYKPRSLVCTKSTVDGELWPSLYEKAYLTVIGDGYNTAGPSNPAAVFAFSQWIPDFGMDIRAMYDDDKRWKELVRAMKKNECIAYLSIKSNKFQGEYQNGKEKGLVQEHAYALLEVVETQKKKLFHIRNPHGGRVWNGNFCPWDKENWKPQMLKDCNYVLKEKNTLNDPEKEKEEETEKWKGEFWMEIEDVKKWFDNGTVCYNPSLFPYQYEYHFAWKAKDYRNPSNTLIAHAPQFLLKRTSKQQNIWILLQRHYQQPIPINTKKEKTKKKEEEERKLQEEEEDRIQEQRERERKKKKEEGKKNKKEEDDEEQEDGDEQEIQEAEDGQEKRKKRKVIKDDEKVNEDDVVESGIESDDIFINNKKYIQNEKGIQIEDQLDGAWMKDNEKEIENVNADGNTNQQNNQSKQKNLNEEPISIGLITYQYGTRTGKKIGSGPKEQQIEEVIGDEKNEPYIQNVISRENTIATSCLNGYNQIMKIGSYPGSCETEARAYGETNFGDFTGYFMVAPNLYKPPTHFKGDLRFSLFVFSDKKIPDGIVKGKNFGRLLSVKGFWGEATPDSVEAYVDIIKPKENQISYVQSGEIVQGTQNKATTRTKIWQREGNISARRTWTKKGSASRIYDILDPDNEKKNVKDVVEQNKEYQFYIIPFLHPKLFGSKESYDLHVTPPQGFQLKIERILAPWECMKYELCFNDIIKPPEDKTKEDLKYYHNYYAIRTLKETEIYILFFFLHQPTVVNSINPKIQLRYQGSYINPQNKQEVKNNQNKQLGQAISTYQEAQEDQIEVMPLTMEMHDKYQVNCNWNLLRVPKSQDDKKKIWEKKYQEFVKKCENDRKTEVNQQKRRGGDEGDEDACEDENDDEEEIIKNIVQRENELKNDIESEIDEKYDDEFSTQQKTHIGMLNGCGCLTYPGHYVLDVGIQGPDPTPFYAFIYTDNSAIEFYSQTNEKEDTELFSAATQYLFSPHFDFIFQKLPNSQTSLSNKQVSFTLNAEGYYQSPTLNINNNIINTTIGGSGSQIQKGREVQYDLKKMLKTSLVSFELLKLNQNSTANQNEQNNSKFVDYLKTYKSKLGNGGVIQTIGKEIYKLEDEDKYIIQFGSADASVTHRTFRVIPLISHSQRQTKKQANNVNKEEADECWNYRGNMNIKINIPEGIGAQIQKIESPWETMKNEISFKDYIPSSFEDQQILSQQLRGLQGEGVGGKYTRKFYVINNPIAQRVCIQLIIISKNEQKVGNIHSNFIVRNPIPSLGSSSSDIANLLFGIYNKDPTKLNQIESPSQTKSTQSLISKKKPSIVFEADPSTLTEQEIDGSIEYAGKKNGEGIPIAVTAQPCAVGILPKAGRYVLEVRANVIESALLVGFVYSEESPVELLYVNSEGQL